jgi:cytochrome P450
MSTDLTWDPIDTTVDDDPYPVWKRMRDEHPLYHNEEYGFWALSRYADVSAAHRDPLVFSSAHGTVLEIMGPEPLRGGSIIFMDPPKHDTLRALVSRAFTPRRMTALEDRIREICGELLDPHVGAGGFDYVRQFTQQLPSLVISSLLGVPDVDREDVRHHIDLVFHIEPGVGMINDVSFGAQIWLHEYLSGLLAERRRSPGDDLISGLAQAEITDDEGAVRRLTDDEAVDFTNLLVSAGTETVARLLGWAADVLAAHPDQRAELAADPSLVNGAVEELLRYQPPSPVQGRWTTAPVELHGQVVPAESKVLLLTGAAGRDDRAYTDPDRFDIHRRFDQHVSFGLGVHFCIGAALARLEGRVGIEETLRRIPEWDVDHEHAVLQHTSTVRGYSSLPITFG